MSNADNHYLKPGFSPQSPTHPAAKNLPINMSRSSSYDPHKVLGYFDLPSRSAPSSPQNSYIPFSPVSRSSSPAGRDVRRSRDLNVSHSGSDIEETLTGFSLVPNWLKMAMEQDQHSNQSTQKSAPRRPYKYSPLNSPDSIVSSSNDASPITPRTPQLNVALPQNEESTQEKSGQKEEKVEDEEYWAEEDEGYFGELDEDEDEDLEEIYRSVR